MDRRQALRTLGAAAAAAPLATLARLAAAAPSPAGARLDRLGIQLYTVRDVLAKDFDGTLAAIRAAGYREVEMFFRFGRTPAQVKQSIAAAGLTSPATHTDLPGFRKDPAKVAGEAVEAGHRWIVVAYVNPDERKTLDDWKRRRDEITTCAEAAKKAGIGFAYHNHDFEFATVEGVVPYEMLTTTTDPALVKLEMDLFWTVQAGQDPLPWITRWPGRVTMVHVKDRKKDGTMVTVGDGAIDFATLLAEGRKRGLQHWFVEHDQPKDSLDFARKSAAYLGGLRA